MLIGRLTDAKVRSLEKPGRYGDVPGSTLYLIVWPGGSKSWVQRVTIDGKRRDIGLGGYPLVPLRKARERAFANRQQARDGGDPLALKRRAAVPTFEEAAARTYDANRERWRSARTEANWAASMATYAYPVFRDWPVDRIGRRDVLAVLEPTWSTKHALAVKVRGRIRATLGWAQARGYVEHNVAGECLDGALPRLAVVKGHHRALDYREVAAALDAIDLVPGRAPRLGGPARRQDHEPQARPRRQPRRRPLDLDAREWRIPGMKMKGGGEHRVPLSGPAMHVLASVEPLQHPSGLVFPSPSTSSKSMTDMTLTKLLRGCGLSDRTTVHGFRSTFRIWASERTSAPHAVAEAALAHHVGSAVERSYARSDLFEKRRGLMEAWARFATACRAKGIQLCRATGRRVRQLATRGRGTVLAPPTVGPGNTASTTPRSTTSGRIHCSATVF